MHAFSLQNGFASQERAFSQKTFLFLVHKRLVNQSDSYVCFDLSMTAWTQQPAHPTKDRASYLVLRGWSNESSDLSPTKYEKKIKMKRKTQ